MREVVDMKNFVSHLENNGLMIVRKEDYIQKSGLDIIKKQKAFYQRKNVTLLEILKAKVVNVTTKQALRAWIDTGKIRDDEHYKTKKGVIMVRVSAIQRIVRKSTENDAR